MPIGSVKPVHVYQYRDKRGMQGKTAANRDIEVLSHAFTKAIEWGTTENHPIKGKVRKFSTPPRKRYVEDWEVNEALNVSSTFLRCYIRMKLLTGLRRSDLLSIRLPDLKADGIHIKPRKTAASTGKHLVIQWSDELLSATNAAKALRKNVESIWLFPTRFGESYVKADGNANGFDSIWQRFMARALKLTALKEKFTEHDLRAKVASDLEISHAQMLLGHSNSEITERVYRRKSVEIRPAK
jgi:integrase